MSEQGTTIIKSLSWVLQRSTSKNHPQKTQKSLPVLFHKKIWGIGHVKISKKTNVANFLQDISRKQN